MINAHPVPMPEDYRSRSLEESFGINVFGDHAMRERLSDADYASLRDTATFGTALDHGLADSVAKAMMEWANERGATHFTHWFQPMTGQTAEKHDAFLVFSDEQPILEFSGKQLIKGEPDASSFPSGGLRTTFEARGYTAWDPTSPAFIKEAVNGPILCIPTAFCSWTGEALDKKTPLMRSEQALSQQVVRLARLLGDEDTQVAWSTAGPEQEFFLIDRAFFLARPDLVATGRTLIGARPPKGQELEDHYFGCMPPRILACLQEAEHEMWRLGVPVKTRHNEVAPSQYELAPLFERSTLATDHNLLLMEVLRNVAARHGLVCLLHEKPFAGINGSGKHNNWSVATNRGENLLDPGKTPADNARFMLVLTAILRAVDLHADLLRISVARPGNDHRLGANEAPPAIISVYLGEELDSVCRVIMGIAPAVGASGARDMQLGVTSLPQLPRDTTDRNRTSPFAFTLNKFEFRAVGAGQSIADPNMVLNTIVADSIGYLVDEIERRKGAKNRDEAIQEIVAETLKKHYRVVFNGNNYADEWLHEAEQRGLPNLRITPDAVAHFNTPKNVELFARTGVLAANEVEARANIMQEGYAKAIAIEAQSCLGLATTAVLPAAIRYQELVSSSLTATRTAAKGLNLAPQEALLEKLTGRVNELIEAAAQLSACSGQAEGLEEDLSQQVTCYLERVIPAMDRTRAACDALETLIEDEHWILPRYREMLFLN